MGKGCTIFGGGGSGFRQEVTTKFLLKRGEGEGVGNISKMGRGFDKKGVKQK